MRSFLQLHKKTCYIMLAFLLLSLLLFIQSWQSQEHTSVTVTRGQAGSQAESHTFSYQVDDGSRQNITIDVDAVELTEEEAFPVLDEAVAEWEQEYLGENESENEVRKSLVFPDSVQDGLVTISYETDQPDVLGIDGTIHAEDLNEEGETVKLTITFSCQDYTRTEQRFVQVKPPKKQSPEWFALQLKKQIALRQEASRTQSEFELPETVEGHSVTWIQEPDYTWIYLLVLGCLAAVCLELKEKETKRRNQKERAEKLTYEYPQMVEQISLLLESGMTLRAAWERIITMDLRHQKLHPGQRIFVEEMKITYREMREGGSERIAYEKFGQRIGLASYRHFASVLTQNLAKGTRDLKIILEQEAKNAMELRKNAAIRKGEEAGTKLLLPILLMFLLIMIILLVPAAQQFLVI